MKCFWRPVFRYYVWFQAGDADNARTDITRPDNAAPDSKGGHRETGQLEQRAGSQASVPESTAAGGTIRTYVCDDGL